MGLVGVQIRSGIHLQGGSILNTGIPPSSWHRSVSLDDSLKKKDVDIS